jgi:polypeptide N-acetylgalactosaminyltransferase
MSGGLLAVKKSYFHEIGEFDMGMEVWGSENIEMSVRVRL